MPRRPYTRYPCGIYGPRNLVRRHTRRLLLKNGILQARGFTVEDKPPKLLPGQEKLYSFYQPSLEAGVYTATVTQEIVSPQTDEKQNLPSPGTQSQQMFEVVAPRFNLPDGAINSSFPPQGYGALAKTLPHVVLADPHLPWDRIASAHPKKTNPEYYRNKVPWLALLVFTVDELKLPANKLSGNDSIFINTSFGKTSVTQSQTFTIHMDVAEVREIKSTISPINALHPEPSDKTTNVILVPSTLFAELVTSYDNNGDPIPKQSGPDVSRYKFLAHTRDINTVGMAEAGVEDNGVFGIVISHRTGPLSNTQPQPVIAHLVSIEDIESQHMNEHWPINFEKIKYVALSSLYSWNFVTLPEGSFDIETTFRNLGEGLDLLRAPKEIITQGNRLGNRLQKRLEDGYTLTKYRTMTGEITAAITRGPLTPTIVPYPLLPKQKAKTGFTWLSNAGINLEIMDQQVGLMDITYAVAWQLGKTLAVADKTFATSLIKLRALIYDQAITAAKAEVLRSLKGYKSRGELISNLPKTISVLKTLHKATPGLHAPNGSMQDRWRRPQVEHPDLGYYSPKIQAIFPKHAQEAGRRLMLSSDGDGNSNYDEHNTPSSVDWMIVLHWVLDKMFLYSIPAQYLIADPSYLAPETLRFFHIDRNWTDALIDGALSLGNRLDGVDQVRQVIQGMIEAYLNPSPGEIDKRPKPQVPTYGFLLHSEAVTKYPDLKVDVVITQSRPITRFSEKAPILRHDNLDVIKGVMICLFDQVPAPAAGDPGLKSITFTEPPHQQSFIAGAELDSRHIKTLYKRIFTLPHQKPDPKPWTSKQWNHTKKRKDDADPPELEGAVVPHKKAVFKWGPDPDPNVRTLLLPAWAEDVNGVLNYYGGQSSPPVYKDDFANAAMAGVQLNNPIYRLVIAVKGKSDSSSSVQFPPTIDSGSVDLTGIRPTPTTSTTTSAHPPVPDNEPTLTTTGALSADLRIPGNAPVPRVNSGFILMPSHGPPDVPPPHYRRLGAPAPYSETHITKSSSSRSLDVFNGPPQYTFKCFPLDNNLSARNPGIPIDGKYPLDLVFAITQDPYRGGDYNLQSMTIMFELAYNNAEVASGLYLLRNYTGPGPTMLSNLRFYALSRIYTPDHQAHPHRNCMEIIVRPRTTARDGTTPPDQSIDMSFILPVCDVLKRSDPHKKIRVYTTAAYLNETPITHERDDVIKFKQH